MISHSIKWFLGLSVAVHTAAMIAWTPPEQKIGNSGQVLLLAIRDKSGGMTAQPQAPAVDRTPPQQPAAPLPKPPVVPDKQQAAKQPAVQPPVETATSVQARSEQTRQPIPATQAVSTALSREQLDQHLRDSVLNLITRKLTYPAIARRKGWQGVVVLELHIESNGQISDLRIDETSGYAVLDEAALRSLQLANIPDAAQWLHGEAREIVIPVEYRLTDS